MTFPQRGNTQNKNGKHLDLHFYLGDESSKEVWVVCVPAHLRKIGPMRLGYFR